MKKATRILITAFAVISLLFVTLTVSSANVDTDAKINEAVDASSVTDEKDAVSENLISTDLTAKSKSETDKEVTVSNDSASIGEAEDLTPESDSSIEEEKTFFEGLFKAFESSASEILSALAFVGSLIIMLSYKRGLLPIVNDGVKTLRSGMKAIGEKAESFNEHAIGICDSIDERLERAEKLAEAVLRSAESTEEQLCEFKAKIGENEKLEAVLNAQIDMLYEIFMSAALPQYLKDGVGEKIAKMRAELKKEADDERLA